MPFATSPFTRKAQIVDLASGRVVVTYPIDLPAHNNPNAEWEMMERAWRYAVEDGITRHDARNMFSVRIVPIDWIASTKPLAANSREDANV